MKKLALRSFVYVSLAFVLTACGLKHDLYLTGEQPKEQDEVIINPTSAEAISTEVHAKSNK